MINMKSNKKKLNAFSKKIQVINKKTENDTYSTYIKKNPLLFHKTHYSENFIIRSNK